MANTSYPLGMQKLLGASIDFLDDTIKAALLPSTYTFSAAHEFVAALGTRIGTDQTLTGKSVTGGVLDADDPDFGALAPGNTVKALVIYKDTGNASTSPVLFYYDVVAGFPFATNGGALTVPWDSSVKKIARVGLPFYPLGAQKLLSAEINFSADTLKVVALPVAYVYGAGHEFLSDVGTVVGTAQTLTGKSITGGVFDAADTNFGAIAAGPTLGSLMIYKEGGTPETSPVLLHLTAPEYVVGLPLAANGFGISHQWPNGTAKIFSLVPA